MTAKLHALAILEAQWLIYRNTFRKMPTGTVATAIFAILWYGLWTALAAGAMSLFAGLPRREMVRLLPISLLGISLYWQVFPILLVSSGVALDLRKLRPYPIPLPQLFWLEVMLRITASVEMVLLLLGVTIGLARNHEVAWWGPLFLLPLLLLNLFFSTGLRNILMRVFARKRYQALVSLVVLTLVALPQALIAVGSHGGHLERWSGFTSGPFWPWTAASVLGQGVFSPVALAALAAWLAGAYAFARWQFRRTFSYDEDSTGERERAPRRTGAAEAVFSLPSRLLRDPLGAIVEKELRFLSRAPRFRVLFMMGFSFGLLIFLPTMLRSREKEGFMAAHFLTFVGAYALLLLGEVLFWNNLGFDRSAAQLYYATPVRFRTVLIGKNIAAACFALAEVLVLAAVCTALRSVIGPVRVTEALCVILVLTLYLTSMGNISSVRNGRGVNPAQSLRGTGAGRAQMMLFLLYPLALLPIGLAFGARFAFESELAFYLVLLLDLIIGALVYQIALESAEAAAMQRQEQLLTDLSQGGGLVSA